MRLFLLMLSITCPTLLAQSFYLTHGDTGKRYGPFEYRDGATISISGREFTLEYASGSEDELNVETYVAQVLEDGVLVNGYILWANTKSEYERISKQGGTKYQRREGNKIVQRGRQLERPAFIYCDSSNYIDGQHFQGVVWQSGRYQYSSVVGAVSSVRLDAIVLSCSAFPSTDVPYRVSSPAGGSQSRDHVVT